MTEPTDAQREIENIKLFRKRVKLSRSNRPLAEKINAKQAIANSCYKKRIKAEIDAISNKYTKLKKENLDKIYEMLIRLSFPDSETEFLPLPTYPEGKSEMSDSIHDFILELNQKIKAKQLLTYDNKTNLLAPIKAKFETYFEKDINKSNALFRFLLVTTVLAALLVVLGMCGPLLGFGFGAILAITLIFTSVAIIAGWYAVPVKDEIESRKSRKDTRLKTEEQKIDNFFTDYNGFIDRGDLSLEEDDARADIAPEVIKKIENAEGGVTKAYQALAESIKNNLTEQMETQLFEKKCLSASFDQVYLLYAIEVQKINKGLKFMRKYHGVSSDLLPDVSFEEVKKLAEDRVALKQAKNFGVAEQDKAVADIFRLQTERAKLLKFQRTDTAMDTAKLPKDEKVFKLYEACGAFYKAKKAQAKAVAQTTSQLAAPSA